MKKFKLRWHAGKSAVIKSAIVIVDEEEAYRLRTRTYRVAYINDRPSTIEYNTDSGKTKYVLAREIMKCKEGEKVKHLNGDVLDCRKDNMRVDNWIYRKPAIVRTGPHKRR